MSDSRPALDVGAGILIVEDEDAIRLTVRDYLVRRGYTVHVASDGVGAIRQMLDHPVSVLVTDYRMEIFGGDYWLRFLGRYCSSGANKIDVIVTSGFVRTGTAMPFVTLAKPFDYSELVRLIEAFGYPARPKTPPGGGR